MILRGLLGAMAGGIIVFALMARRSLKAAPVIIACLGALYFLLRPGDANKLADFVGIGRGADVVIYLWIAVSMFLILRLHVVLVQIRRDFTDLARHIALRDSVGAQRSRGSAPAGEDAEPVL